MAVVVDAGEGADGANDGVGGGGDVLGFFDEESEGVARPFHAEAEEAEGVGVTVNDATVGQIEFVGESGRALPMKDALFDGFAFGVVADGALGFVICEPGWLLLSAAVKSAALRAICEGWGRGKSRFQVDFGLWKILAFFRDDGGAGWLFQLDGNVCDHLNLPFFLDFRGAGQSGWVCCGERRRGRGLRRPVRCATLG